MPVDHPVAVWLDAYRPEIVSASVWDGGLSEFVAGLVMELLQRFSPDLVHVGDIRDKVEKEMGALYLGPDTELRIAYALDSVLTFYEGHPRARLLKPGGIYHAFKDVPDL